MIPVVFLTAICMSRQVRPVPKSVRADRFRQHSGHSFARSPTQRDGAARTHCKAQQHTEETWFGEDWVEEARRRPEDCSSDNPKPANNFVKQVWLLTEAVASGLASAPASQPDGAVAARSPKELNSLRQLRFSRRSRRASTSLLRFDPVPVIALLGIDIELPASVQHSSCVVSSLLRHGPALIAAIRLLLRSQQAHRSHPWMFPCRLPTVHFDLSAWLRHGGQRGARVLSTPMA